ncbi:aldose epimerase family protein [Oenococcus oeni]|uniref:aldose epimerase family protein n=1 Tax=Oenococcus oeni TaxID=1247 RepID=UPI00050EF6E8|nr:aldose epimerase family protein [Oenococcus oeni]KGH55709.1 aldose epimerase [Oenococcus oeni S22]OIK82482.1 galactose mutarotase [Oenococcus oeni]OIL91287.1 galactose mutarotase [Oenococcus oeni]
MRTLETDFGQYKKQRVVKYTLENQSGTRISVLNFAGIWQEFSVLEKGQRRQLLLQGESIKDYINNDLYLNRVIARTAGRIDQARFVLKQKLIQTLPNEQTNSLHGGPKGFAQQFFNVTVNQEQGQIILKKTLSETDDSFPGTLELTVSYTLTENNQVIVSFLGRQSKADGVFNPTLHAYFNLGQSDDILDHSLLINSQKHLQLNAAKIPTGRLVDNQGPFDLAQHPNLKAPLSRLKKTSKEQGFDDVFVINCPHTGPIARLKDLNSNYELTITSDRNALVVYTANQMASNLHLNHSAKPWSAVALEAQTLPNSENLTSLGNVTLLKDSYRKESISYQFLRG